MRTHALVPESLQRLNPLERMVLGVMLGFDDKVILSIAHVEPVDYVFRTSPEALEMSIENLIDAGFVEHSAEGFYVHLKGEGGDYPSGFKMDKERRLWLTNALDRFDEKAQVMYGYVFDAEPHRIFKAYEPKFGTELKGSKVLSNSYGPTDYLLAMTGRRVHFAAYNDGDETTVLSAKKLDNNLRYVGLWYRFPMELYGRLVLDGLLKEETIKELCVAR